MTLGTKRSNLKPSWSDQSLNIRLGSTSNLKKTKKKKRDVSPRCMLLLDLDQKLSKRNHTSENGITTPEEQHVATVATGGSVVEKTPRFHILPLFACFQLTQNSFCISRRSLPLISGAKLAVDASRNYTVPARCRKILLL